MFVLCFYSEMVFGYPYYLKNNLILGCLYIIHVHPCPPVPTTLFQVSQKYGPNNSSLFQQMIYSGIFFHANSYLLGQSRNMSATNSDETRVHTSYEYMDEEHSDEYMDDGQTIRVHVRGT
jgi:hypothetical protein